MSLDPSFAKQATVTVAIWRAPELSGTPPKRGAPELINAAVKCLPIMALNPEVAAAGQMRNPFRTFQTVAEGETLDVRAGDRLYDGDARYTVHSVARWPINTTIRWLIILEMVQGSYAGS